VRVIPQPPPPRGNIHAAPEREDAAGRGHPPGAHSRLALTGIIMEIYTDSRDPAQRDALSRLYGLLTEAQD
jgi:hypothetical protein